MKPFLLSLQSVSFLFFYFFVFRRLGALPNAFQDRFHFRLYGGTYLHGGTNRISISTKLNSVYKHNRGTPWFKESASSVVREDDFFICI